MVQSIVAGGAEGYLTRLYESGATGTAATVTVFGNLPGWSGPASPLGLSPKWGRRTILQGLVKLPLERRRLAATTAAAPQDAYHLQFKREQLGFTKQLSRLAPVIWTEHGRMTSPFMRLLGPWYRAAARYTSAITCVSEEVAEDVRRVVGPGPRVEVIENAVDTDRFHPATADDRSAARRRFGIPVDGPVLAWVGRLHPDKLPGTAVAVAREWPGHTLIAGTGRSMDELRARSAGNPRVHLLGHVDPLPVYTAADAFMLTSIGEGYPTTILEAASCGLSTVANRGSGTARVVDQFGGSVVADDASPAEWVRALTDVASADHGAEARAWALDHSLASWRARHHDLLQSLI